MLDDLNELRTFQRILARGSLSGAARDLGVGLAVVSKRLASLERRAGLRLINRTTRRLSATEEGFALLPHIDRMLEELAAAEARLASGREEAHGLLRISAPVSLGRIHLVPQVAALVARHPRLDVELKLDDHLIDMIHERIDVAVRIGQPRDSAAIMHKLATNRRILVAAPSYLDQRGRPRTIADLASHVCLRYDDGTTPWRLEGPSAAVAEVEMRSRLRANSGDAVHDWALAGHGVMLKSRVDVAADLAAGRLERVLDGWQGPSAPIYALMSSGSPVATKVRVFLDAMSAYLSDLCTAANIAGLRCDLEAEE
uniref:Transcriptional regulator LysR family n=1 Tax=Aetherobacter fasciculatus TaxID=888830 RepID=A0A3S7UUW3_9BACT|nr:transcriptional regulator LysR family [Aetherobacter fasciculatus]